MGLSKLAALGLGAAMSAVNLMMPPIGGARRPAFVDRAPEYDGLGRKKRIVPPHPYSRKRETRAWQQYREKVLSTHRQLPDGTWQVDPRDDKYLHSSQRWGRNLRKALSAAA
jgi:hypothetical protein